MSAEENKRIARRYFEELWNQGHLNVISEIIAANHTLHDPASPHASGAEGLKRLISGYRVAFPDNRFTIEDQIAEGDKVVTRWTAHGSHKGQLMGMAPTNRQVTVSGVDIHRIINGQITEHWSNWDSAGLMQQLGLTSTEAGGRRDATLTVEQFEDQDADVTTAPPNELEEALEQPVQPGSKGGSSA